MGVAVDPITGDLTLSGGKLVVETSPVRAELVARIKTHKGSCFWDLSFGSTLHELKKVSSSALRDIEERVRAALRPMSLDSLQVVVERVDVGRIDLAVQASKAGRPVAARVFVRV
ncbi:MAG TPA: hypothetical protein PKY30_24405 [Myxococcota bacterium]|nr:hypothetical protein [Myxococcota bacterium]HNH50200.1 hypothetical protein [Myxococcota bacterium]